MAEPSLLVTVDWDVDGGHGDTDDDISADIETINLRQSLHERGVATLIVRNYTGKYTPLNASSVLYPNVQPGRRVWVRAVHSGTTYALFYGVLRRIALHPETRFATLIVEDMTCEWDRMPANVTLSTSRSLRDFRGALLDTVDTDATRRSLAYGVETSIPGVTGADSDSALEVLSDLDEATGSLSFVRPSATVGYQYVTIDRATLQAQASAATWDAETSSGAYTGLTNWDVSDESIINVQYVTAEPGTPSATADEVWTSDLVPFSVAVGDTEQVWTGYSTPVAGATLNITATNSPSVYLESFYTTGRIDITPTGTASYVTALSVTGSSVTGTPATVSVSDAVSVAAYGYRLGTAVSSPWLANASMARGLAEYLVWRHATPRVAPDITRTQDFPSILERFPGDVVAFTSGRVSATAVRLLIVSRDLTATASSGAWEVTYTTEELPAVLNLFTVGGSADQGVGGTGILAH